MINRTHINDLLKYSPVYSKLAGLEVDRVTILPMVCLVHYEYDEDMCVDVWWESVNGWIPNDECDEPTQRYVWDDAEYHTLVALMEAVPQ